VRTQDAALANEAITPLSCFEIDFCFSKDRGPLPRGIYRFLDFRHTFLKSLPSNNDEFQSNRAMVQGDE